MLVISLYTGFLLKGVFHEVYRRFEPKDELS
jgi:hypothetical protein